VDDSHDCRRNAESRARKVDSSDRR
jgi:hypothetical protein